MSVSETDPLFRMLHEIGIFEKGGAAVSPLHGNESLLRLEQKAFLYRLFISTNDDYVEEDATRRRSFILVLYEINIHRYKIRYLLTCSTNTRFVHWSLLFRTFGAYCALWFYSYSKVINAHYGYTTYITYMITFEWRGWALVARNFTTDMQWYPVRPRILWHRT